MAACVSCEYYRSRDKVGEPASSVGECTRYPPTVLWGPDGPTSVIPTVSRSYYCGEFKRR
jgi:hypothetical protein